MYQIERVYIGESQQDEAHIKSEVQTEISNTFRVGDVIRLAENRLLLNCVQCLRSFQHFPEFTLHIEEHFVQDDVFVSPRTIQNNTKNEITISDEIEKDFIYENDQDILEHENDTKIMPQMSYTDILVENENELAIDAQPETKDEVKSQIIQQLTSTSEMPILDLTQIVEGVTYQKIDNQFECMICRSKFANKNNLRSHIGVHVKTKHLCCPICMKGFKSKTIFL